MSIFSLTNRRNCKLMFAIAFLLSITLACASANRSRSPAPRPQAQPSSTERSTGVATLESRVTDVYHLPKNSARSLVAPGTIQPVSTGDGINVSTRGEALLRFREMLQARIFRDSQLEVEPSVDPTVSAAIYLASGALYSTVSSQSGKHIQIATDGSQVIVTGTEFWVHYDAARRITWVVVLTGRVRVAASGMTVTVPAQFQTWIKTGLPPDPPVPATRLLADTLIFPRIDDLTNGAIADGTVLANPQCTTVAATALLVEPGLTQGSIPLTASTHFEAEARSANGSFIFGQGGWVIATALSCPYNLANLPVKELTPRTLATPTATAVRQPPAEPFAVTSVVATAGPIASAVCPARLEFLGTITTNGVGSVTYRWERSDSTATAIESIKFNGAGSQRVNLNWPLNNSFDGWVRLHVLTPISMFSSPTSVKLICAPPTPVPPPTPPIVPTTSGKVTMISVDVKPSQSKNCPTTFEFYANIQANGATLVSYQWERSNSVNSPIEQIVFKTAGVKQIVNSWKINKSFSGWQRLRILSPNQLASIGVPIILVCAAEPDTKAPAAPTIIRPADGAKFSCKSPVFLEWEAPADFSGIRNYRVRMQRSLDGKNWEDAHIWDPVIDKSVDIDPFKQCGRRYRWRLYARDGAGNQGQVSAWAYFSINFAPEP